MVCMVCTTQSGGSYCSRPRRWVETLPKGNRRPRNAVTAGVEGAVATARRVGGGRCLLEAPAPRQWRGPRKTSPPAVHRVEGAMAPALWMCAPGVEGALADACPPVGICVEGVLCPRPQCEHVCVLVGGGGMEGGGPA